MAFSFDVESLIEEMEDKELAGLIDGIEAFLARPEGNLFRTVVGIGLSQETEAICANGQMATDQNERDMLLSIGRRDVLSVLADVGMGMGRSLRARLDALQRG